MKFDNKGNNHKIKDFERNANISKMVLSKFSYNSNINRQRMNELLLAMSKIYQSMVKNSLYRTDMRLYKTAWTMEKN